MKDAVNAKFAFQKNLTDLNIDTDKSLKANSII